LTIPIALSRWVSHEQANLRVWAVQQLEDQLEDLSYFVSYNYPKQANTAQHADRTARFKMARGPPRRTDRSDLHHLRGNVGDPAADHQPGYLRGSHQVTERVGPLSTRPEFGEAKEDVGDCGGGKVAGLVIPKRIVRLVGDAVARLGILGMEISQACSRN
jgi:hypothetical protein